MKADVPLTRDGKAVARIYVSPPSAPIPPVNKTETPALELAARELSWALQKMSGSPLEIIEASESTTIQSPAIVLGSLAEKMGAAPQKTSESKEAFRLLTKGELLLIGGESDEAVLFGAYEVLEKLGCDWLMPGEIGEVIPRKSTVVVPNLDESQAPDFFQRTLWFRGGASLNTPENYARAAQWSRRQKSGRYTAVWTLTAGHYWDQFIKKHKAEFEKDPTMYALVRDFSGNLVRRGPQLESTHPRVIELMAQDIRDIFEKNNWPKDKAAGFPIGPADGLDYSLSPEAVMAGSGRIDPIVGELDRTDELVLLANNIFEKLGPEYSNVYLGNYSYSTHADYPQRYKPHPRYVQIFAPINFSRYHSVLDSNSKTQAYYRDVVRQWGKLSQEQGNPLMFRGYNWNLAENMLPYTKLKTWGEELPFYHRMGVRALNIEATKAWAVNGPGDWVFMKLAWNSKQDWKALLHEYCVKAFGEGAAPMERHFLRQVATQHGAGQEAGSFSAAQLIYNDAFVAAARRDMKQATRLAKLPEEKARVAIFADNITALDLYLKYFAATERFDFAVARKLYNQMLAHWQKSYDANSDMVAKEVPEYLKRFMGSFVEEAAKYSSGDYSMVAALPDELPTLFDPNAVGHRMNFQSRDISDARLIKTKTFSSSWDAQGLAGLRSGAVWYRHRFTLQAKLKGKPISLFLGGVEDEARVWINGQLVGTSGVRFSTPFLFDLTDGINYDGDNLLAIQVIRNSAANEIGMGGILRPGYLFTGPRLPNKAPQSLQIRRVLPGGELGEVLQ